MTDLGKVEHVVEVKKTTHDKYSASDSDITIESADNVLFRLHTQNLRITTGAFPGSEFSTEGEPTKLTEDADVLEVIFAYIYPQRHPNLKNTEFSVLEKIAEAVEKYEVFPAMNICAVRMREFLPRYADDILVYGVKHDYPDLVNESALALSRSPSMSQFLPKFSPPTILAWIQYSESWKAIFESAVTSIESFDRTLGSCDNLFSRASERRRTSRMCDTCRVALFKWLMKTEKITSLQDLKTTLAPPAHRDVPDLVYCTESGGCSNNGKCIHMEKVAKVIENGIACIPPFEHYLYQPMVSL